MIYSGFDREKAKVRCLFVPFEQYPLNQKNLINFIPKVNASFFFAEGMLSRCAQGGSLDSSMLLQKKKSCVLHEIICLQKPQGLFLLTTCR